MAILVSLWMPIVVSAIFVFLVSSVLHMVLTYHWKDCRSLPREAETLAALRSAGLAPGLYTFPHAATPKEMGTPEMIEKFEAGPVGMMTVLPNGPIAMGRMLTLWFAHCLVIGVFVAYLTHHSVAADAHYLAVFRVAGTSAFLAHGLGQLADSIWKGQPWPVTLKHVFDGLVYALVTAGTFGWLWPG